MSHNYPSPYLPDRRAFLVASTVGFAGMRFGSPAAAAVEEASRPVRAKAKSTILFFLCGGSSHMDTWDMKLDAPREYRGSFEPIDTSVPGMQISEHMPMLAKQMHHLAVIRSLSASVNTNDHHAGYYYRLTGHPADATFLSLGNNRTPMPDDWPYMGSVVGSRRQSKSGLPSCVTLPHMPSRLPYTRPGQFAARLGVEHDPLYVLSEHQKPLKFEAPALVLGGDVDPRRLSSRGALLETLNEARRKLDAGADVEKWSNLQDRAFSLLGASQTTAAFNVAEEPESVRERYGQTLNGLSLLAARRLVEVGVPFITVFWKEFDDRKTCANSGWDTHGDNFNCLKDHLLPTFDRGFSALVEDLSNRGLLDETLLLVTSEMGRTPKIGDRRSGGVAGAGRDHWTHSQSIVMAGGGIKGGQFYGSTDKLGERPADKPVTPADVAKTIYQQMGVHDLEAKDPDGRVFNLMAEGNPIAGIL